MKKKIKDKALESDMDLSRVSDRKGKFPYLDEAVWVWFQNSRMNKLIITENIIQIEALDIKIKFLLKIQNS